MRHVLDILLTVMSLVAAAVVGIMGVFTTFLAITDQELLRIVPGLLFLFFACCLLVAGHWFARGAARRRRRGDEAKRRAQEETRQTALRRDGEKRRAQQEAIQHLDESHRLAQEGSKLAALRRDKANRLAQEEARQAKQLRDKAKGRAKQEAGQTALQRVNQVLDQLLHTHAGALMTQRRKLISRDPYGNEVRRGWDRELAYFRGTIVEPVLLDELSMQEREQAHVQMKRALDKATRASLAEKHGEQAFDYYFETYIDAAVDRAVERMLAEPAASVPDDVSNLSPTEFESMCADLLTKAGWDARVVAGAGDQGVDVVARRDGATVVFQCKLYSSPLGNKPVQEVHTGRTFYDAQIAAVVSNADYTPGARVAAEQTDVRLLHYSELATFDADFGS